MLAFMTLCSAYSVQGNTLHSPPRPTCEKAKYICRSITSTINKENEQFKAPSSYGGGNIPGMQFFGAKKVENWSKKRWISVYKDLRIGLIQG